MAVIIDGSIFRAYYGANVVILTIFSITIGLVQFLGNPIVCDKKIIFEEFVDTYCWRQAYYYDKNGNLDGEPRNQVFSCTFFYLLCQIFIFTLPHVMWKSLEGNRIQSHISEIKDGEKQARAKSISTIILDEETTDTWTPNNIYMLKYFFCSFPNPAVLIGQFFFIKYSFGMEFALFGRDKLGYIFNFSNFKDDPTDRIFPKTVACIFPWDMTVHEVSCDVPINYVNDKIFLFLWFWFASLIILSLLEITFWTSTWYSLKIRAMRLRVQAAVLAMGEPMTVRFQRKIEFLVTRCTIGDLFVLSLLGKNLDGSAFKYLLLDLYTQRRKEQKN